MSWGLRDFQSGRRSAWKVPARLAQLQPVLSFPSFSSGFDYSDVGIERRYEAKDDVLWQKGSHSIKFGVDYSQVPFADDAPAGYAARSPSRTTIRSIRKTRHRSRRWPRRTTSRSSPLPFRPSIPARPPKQLGLYIMDEWRIRSGLTATIGLRYDREFGDFDENLKPSQFPVTIPFLGDPSQRGAKQTSDRVSGWPGT